MNVKKYVKTVQRRANLLVRNLNKSIEEDELWLGRFYVRQLCRDVYRFEDGSGASISFLFELVDKKTGIRDLARFDNYDLRIANEKKGGSWSLWWALNDFIVKKVDVWHETPEPSIRNAVDYRKVKFLGQPKLKQLRYYL